MLYYSADPALTISRLRKGDIDACVDVGEVQADIDRWNISAFVLDEVGYHFKFLKIPSRPYIVYAMGNISLLDTMLLGIVGPRKSSPYAERVMQDLFKQLGTYDLVTISGGAPGIDTQCHRYSINYTIPTIVVLGGGILHYLQGSRRQFLLDIVSAGGLILSEFKLWQDPTPWSFPQRNRIIAGLCDVLFVPAAGKKSGSLITVDFAVKMRTPIYTVPASTYELTSRGSNAYLAAGKMMAVQNFQDMLENHFPQKVGHKKSVEVPSTLEEVQQKLLQYLSTHPQSTTDQLAEQLGISFPKLLVELTQLEMLGLIYTDLPNTWSSR